MCAIKILQTPVYSHKPNNLLALQVLQIITKDTGNSIQVRYIHKKNTSVNCNIGDKGAKPEEIKG